MNVPVSIDYKAALEEFRKEEHAPDNPIHSTDKPDAPPMIDGYVDYQAVIAAWDKEQKGLLSGHPSVLVQGCTDKPIL